jgi:RloB-like protein
MAKRGKLALPPSRDKIERAYHPRKHQYVILIVCEDEATERAYFERFLSLIPERTIFLDVYGTGFDPLGVVEEAIAKQKRFERLNGLIPDEVWTVFDVDDADKEWYPSKGERFSKALRMAKTHEIKTAFSHEVFELWLLLHLQEVAPSTPLPRKTVYGFLEQAIRHTNDLAKEFNYVHGKKDVLSYVEGAGNESAALLRAKQLDEYWHKAGGDFLQCNPSTQVYKLVASIRAWIAYYSYTA